MNFPKFWAGLATDEQIALAEACGTSRQYLYMISKGHKAAGPHLARELELHSRGQVTRPEIDPHLFGPIPELQQHGTTAA